MSVVTWEPGAPFLGEAVVTIGVFDGVHLGHQALISSACSEARTSGSPCVAVTFDRDPDQVVTPENAAPQLLTVADKCRFLKRAGADTVLVIPFDVELALLAPGIFVEHVLLQALRPRGVHVGADFRFGRYAEGNVATLSAEGARHGFSVCAHDLLTWEGAPITSTYIRSLVARGDVSLAARLLGRDHRVTGSVVRGRGAGRRDLSVATANLLPSEHAALPADGVYAGWALVDGTLHKAALSVGVPPTFAGARHQLEAHVLDFDEDLYGRSLTVGFTRRLRSQRRFSSLVELSAAIKGDIEAARAIAPIGEL
ncbi:MAG: bifunctional riboflavin kinase/FAD synthetase [Coriobacteriia bacterium]|nr:bifunctional riboflavin kinase/FAD synthetase [Coriobacteriia bacterium]